jgi:FixJ family two-component response regulator
MSGLAFQEELAKAGVALPVIFITGHGDVPMTVRAMKAGAAEFLTKPFDDQVLLDAIHAAIERDRARRRDAASLAALKARYDELTERERQVMKLRRGGTGEQADRGRARAEPRHREGPPRAGHAQDAREIGCRAGAHG